MKLHQLVQSVFHDPALILPEAHASIRHLIETRLESNTSPLAREPGKGVCGEDIEVESMEVVDGVAYIPIGGVLGINMSPFERGEGAVDVGDVMEELDLAEVDDVVRMAILMFDSPGGMVNGTPELSDRVMQFDKPIFAFSRTLIASAAYWVACATDGIYLTQSASAGSVGVYVPVHDLSALYAKEGVRVELIKAGKLKGLGYPGTVLDDAGRKHLQDQVNRIYGQFTGHVRERRGPQIVDETMQGQCFMAREALERGLIDGIVRDVSEVAAIVALD